ncbi:MAG: putative Na+/H+ antiporter [Chlamydiales bacterium]|nr:putative Na+/H+ antiporter [Chlamydiia bacterium]MCP5508704.1 putative Na+/H+ antiporter [Chlamydiales bacterium]
MKTSLRSILLFLFYVLVATFLIEVLYLACADCGNHDPVRYDMILNSSGYPTPKPGMGVMEQLQQRLQIQPFNLMATIVFVCAILHTFMAHRFTLLSKRAYDRNVYKGLKHPDTFGVEFLRFMGEVEVIFGVWIIPLMIVMAIHYNWATAVNYLSTRNYTEPLFVVVIMSLASTKPIVKLAENGMRFVAKLGGESVTAWWWTILTIGPLSGSFITEPGAMTISALLLGNQFYQMKPSKPLAYATIGLLFVNISVGGIFTSFAAPPVLMVSRIWDWDTPYMFTHFGAKAVFGILIANSLYYIIFRREMRDMEKRRKEEEVVIEKVDEEDDDEIPFWVSLTHMTFLAWTVVHNHYPVIFAGSFLLFLGFYRATKAYQWDLELKTPVLVGFFLAGLVVHGSLQEWWITPVLSQVSEEGLLVLSTILTAFNDNAEVTFLASLIPTFTESMKYAVVAGAVTGGGLTVIANAPNPLGQALLNRYFYQNVGAMGLLLGAITPTLIMALSFYFLRHP